MLLAFTFPVPVGHGIFIKVENVMFLVQNLYAKKEFWILYIFAAIFSPLIWHHFQNPSDAEWFLDVNQKDEMLFQVFLAAYLFFFSYPN